MENDIYEFDIFYSKWRHKAVYDFIKEKFFEFIVDIFRLEHNAKNRSDLTVFQK